MTSKLCRKCSTKAPSLQIHNMFILRVVHEYFLSNDRAGVTPIPDATAIRFSLSIAGELKGERKGPITNAGLCVGVAISSIKASDQSPHLLTQIDEVFGLGPGNTVNA